MATTVKNTLYKLSLNMFITFLSSVSSRTRVEMFLWVQTRCSWSSGWREFNRREFDLSLICSLARWYASRIRPSAANRYLCNDKGIYSSYHKPSISPWNASVGRVNSPGKISFLSINRQHSRLKVLNCSVVALGILFRNNMFHGMDLRSNESL